MSTHSVGWAHIFRGRLSKLLVATVVFPTCKTNGTTYVSLSIKRKSDGWSEIRIGVASGPLTIKENRNR